MFAILISLMLSITLSEADSAPAIECWTNYGAIGKAPQNTLPDQGLPWVYAAEGGVIFPPAAARSVIWRLRCLEAWPTVAQAKLDEQAASATFLLQREKDLTRQLQGEITPIREGLPLISVALVAGISFAIGVLAGGATVYVLSH